MHGPSENGQIGCRVPDPLRPHTSQNPRFLWKSYTSRFGNQGPQFRGPLKSEQIANTILLSCRRLSDQFHNLSTQFVSNHTGPARELYDIRI